jgi:hypothetical protein
MIRLALVLILFLTATAQAETIRVSSGEHGAFTRLVFFSGQNVAKVEKNEDGGIHVAFSNGPHRFDISKVFDKIDRNRVGALSVTQGGGIRIDLSCNCDYLLLAENDLTILDISIAENSHLDQKVSVPSESAPLALAFGTIATSGTRNPPLPLQMSVDGLSPNDGPVGNPAPSEILFDEHLGSLEAELMHKVSRAISQGVLQVREKDPQLLPSISSENRILGGDIAATKYDHGQMFSKVAVEEEKPELIQCLEPRLFTVSDWAQDEYFGPYIGQISAALTNEVGRVNDAEVLNLARYYLHFGFGEEASASLLLTNVTSEEVTVLKAIAAVLRRPEKSVAGVLAKLVYCESPAALWALLDTASPNIPPDTDRKSVLQAFQALPASLRLFLGPVLAEKFSNSGDDINAAIILRGMESGSAERHLEGVLAKVDAQANLPVEKKLQALTELASSGTEVAISALIQKTEIELSSHASIDPETISLIQSYQQEYQGAPVASELGVLLVKALSAVGRFEEAKQQFEILPPMENGLGELFDLVLLSAIRDAGPAQLLRFVASIDESQRASVGRATRTSLSSKLLALGFPGMARAWMMPHPPDPNREERLTLASLALRENRPRAAGELLLGLEGSDVDALQVEIRDITNDLVGLAKTRRDAGDFEGAIRADVVAGRWEALTDTVEPALSFFADLRVTTDEPDTAGPLTESQALAEEAISAAKAIRSLLAWSKTSPPKT